LTDRIKADAQSQLDEFTTGSSEDSITLSKQRESEQSPFAQQVKDVVNTENTIYGIGKSLVTGVQLLGEDDPNFDATKRFEQVRDSLPPQLWGKAATASSEEEIQLLLEMSNDERASKDRLMGAGISQSVAGVLGTIMDVDAALMFVSGGSYLGPKLSQAVTKATLGRSTRLASIGFGAGAGMEAAALSEVSNRFIRPEYESAGLPTMVLSGLVFGSSIGALTRLDKLANKTTQDMLGEVRLKKQEKYLYDTSGVVDDDGILQMNKVLDSTKAAHEVPEPKGETPKTEWRPGMSEEGSAGAAKVNATFGVQLSSRTAGITEASEAALEKIGFQWKPEGRSAWVTVVDAFEDTLNKLPWLRTDWDTAMMSRSPTLQLLALQTMENSSGRFRGINNTGAILKEQYLPQITQNIAVSNDAYKLWSKESKIPQSRESRKQFDTLVREEMYNRYIDATPTTNAGIKLYADAMDADFAKALELMKNAGVHGAETLEHFSGWMPQRWSGHKMIDMLNSGMVAREQIELGLIDGYRKMHPDWSDDALKATAKAVVTRSISMTAGMDTNVYRILQQDGRTYLEEMLLNNNMPKDQIDKFLDKLTKDLENKGKTKILKSRNEIDPRTPIPGTDFRVMDLMEDNLTAVNLRYARTAAGVSALSKSSGIRSKADFDLMKDAILDEVKALGGSAIKPEYLDNIWAHFSGGALGQGINDWARRATQLSNLGLLNQLGLTQASETGMLIAANGFESFMEVAPLWKEIMANPAQYKPVLRELEQIGIAIRGEHNLIRPDKMLDEMPLNVQLKSIQSNDPDLYAQLEKFFESGGSFDNLLSKGQRVQGFISGYYAVHHAQTWAFARTYLQHFGKLARGDKALSKARLYDMGFKDDEMYNRIISAFKKNVEYDGKVVSALNIEKWKPEDIQDFSSIMHRAIRQNIQKGLTGETAFWQTKELGHLMSNLRNFTLTGLKKQTIRHMRIADAQTVASVLWGVPIAGMMYAARQALNGKDENLTPEKIVKGAIGYSNLTAPIPMLTDPFSAILGLDSMQFGMYGARDYQGTYDFIPGIPAFDTLNKMGGIPQSLIGLATNSADVKDISALQAAPLFGNALGFNYMFNSMKDDVRAEKQRARRAEKQAQPVATKPKVEQIQSDKKDIPPTNPLYNGGDSASETINKALEVGQ